MRRRVPLVELRQKLPKALFEMLYIQEGQLIKDIQAIYGGSYPAYVTLRQEYGLSRRTESQTMEVVAKKKGYIPFRKGTTKLTGKQSRGYRLVPIFPEDPLYSMAIPSAKCFVGDREARHIMEHRLIMARHLGRVLHPWEAVHHRNGVKQDNRLPNLLLELKGHHRGKIKCPHCHKEFAIR